MQLIHNMKSVVAVLISYIVLGISCGVKGSENNAGVPSIKSSTPSAMTVLELFTSEGCSSCPSAERLLPQLIKSGAGIYALSYHVDYWDNLGWKDPFSKGEFTERQSNYGKKFNLKSIYTPQLVINGKYEMVGSNRITAEKTIQSQLNEKPAVIIKIEDYKKNNDEISFSYNLEGNWQHTLLLSALVQREAIATIHSGENKNLTLTHTNVVRVLKTINSIQGGTISLTKPHDLADDNWNIILYVQDKKNLYIMGATALR